MTTPAARSQQQQQAAAQIAQILATTSVTAAAPTLTALLAAVGVSAAASSAALTLIGASSAPPVLLSNGPASRATAASEQIYRAGYLLGAAERIQSRLNQGMTRREAMLAERGNFRAHLLAQANRRRAALAVDAAAGRHGSILGWKATLDARTGPECRAANGRNFSVFARPSIGWPGTVHPHCRCRPAAPFVGAGLVDQVATATERREAVA